MKYIIKIIFISISLFNVAIRKFKMIYMAHILSLCLSLPYPLTHSLSPSLSLSYSL